MECRTSHKRHAPGAKIANSNESDTFDPEHVQWRGYDFIMIYIRAETTRCADGRGRPINRPTAADKQFNRETVPYCRDTYIPPGRRPSDSPYLPRLKRKIC